MSSCLEDYLIVCIFSVVVSLVWFAIHYSLKCKMNKVEQLSPKQNEWMNVSKYAGYLFLICPIIVTPIVWLFDWAGGVIGLLIIIGAPDALIKIMKRG